MPSYLDPAPPDGGTDGAELGMAIPGELDSIGGIGSRTLLGGQPNRRRSGGISCVHNRAMERGDLAVSIQPRWVVVLEGVLALVVQEHGRKRLRRTTTYHILWHEVPLKRITVMKHRWPQAHLQIVSFLGQGVIDQAAEYLNMLNVPYDSLTYFDMDAFCDMIRFNPDIQAVYDSDPDNLDRFGQLGRSVTRGYDF